MCWIMYPFSERRAGKKGPARSVKGWGFSVVTRGGAGEQDGQHEEQCPPRPQRPVQDRRPGQRRPSGKEEGDPRPLLVPEGPHFKLTPPAEITPHGTCGNMWECVPHPLPMPDLEMCQDHVDAAWESVGRGHGVTCRCVGVGWAPC